MLRQAVRENVDVIEGRYRFRKRTPSQHLQRLARAFFFAAVPLALFASAYLLSGAADGWFESRRTADTARFEEARAASERARVEVERARAAAQVAASRLEARRSLDSSVEAQGEEAMALPEPIDRELFPLNVRRVVLDPGHGGKSTGTRSPGGMLEKTLTLDISERLQLLLQAAAYEVEMTRTGDRFVSLEDRAALANETQGDIFVSIHLNWIETRQVRGVETYYLGPTDDPYLKALAERENQDAGYSLADYRRMLDRVYADVRRDESRRLATAVQEQLYSYLRRVNPQLQDRGVKKAPFIVLTGTEMPAILAEVSCLSNEKESRLLMSPEYRQFIAEALFDGIDFYARSLGGANQVGS